MVGGFGDVFVYVDSSFRVGHSGTLKLGAQVCLNSMRSPSLFLENLNLPQLQTCDSNYEIVWRLVEFVCIDCHFLQLSNLGNYR